MAGRTSSATERALRRHISGGESVAASARAEGVNPSTLFRAIARQRLTEGEATSQARTVIVGAGALGRELAQWLRLAGRTEPVVYLDDTSRGPQVIGSVDSYERLPGDEVLIAIANPAARQAVAERIQAASFSDPSAKVGACTIGVGTLLMPNALVSVNATLGECCIVNTGSSVGHDVTLGDYCTLSSQVDITGRVRVGKRVMFGTGARVLPGIAIGDDAVIGAGAVVVRDVPAGITVFGNPARAVA